MRKTKKMNPTIEPHHFEKEARRIRKKVSKILAKWGLQARFKRWRLTQDPETGMIVLFGILNSRYIANYTATPFESYFNPLLLEDLKNNTQLQVVSCNSDGGLRYAFILQRGSLGKIPSHIDLPVVIDDKPLIRVVYGDLLQPMSIPSGEVALVEDENILFVREGVGAFLKVFDDIQLRDEAPPPSDGSLPEIMVVAQETFNQELADRQRHKHINRLVVG